MPRLTSEISAVLKEIYDISKTEEINPEILKQWKMTRYKDGSYSIFDNNNIVSGSDFEEFLFKNQLFIKKDVEEFVALKTSPQGWQQYGFDDVAEASLLSVLATYRDSFAQAVSSPQRVRQEASSASAAATMSMAKPPQHGADAARYRSEKSASAAKPPRFIQADEDDDDKPVQPASRDLRYDQDLASAMSRSRAETYRPDSRYGAASAAYPMTMSEPRYYGGASMAAQAQDYSMGRGEQNVTSRISEVIRQIIRNSQQISRTNPELYENWKIETGQEETYSILNNNNIFSETAFEDFLTGNELFIKRIINEEEEESFIISKKTSQGVLEEYDLDDVGLTSLLSILETYRDSVAQVVVTISREVEQREALAARQQELADAAQLKRTMAESMRAQHGRQIISDLFDLISAAAKGEPLDRQKLERSGNYIIDPQNNEEAKEKIFTNIRARIAAENEGNETLRTAIRKQLDNILVYYSKKCSSNGSLIALLTEIRGDIALEAEAEAKREAETSRAAAAVAARPASVSVETPVQAGASLTAAQAASSATPAQAEAAARKRRSLPATPQQGSSNTPRRAPNVGDSNAASPLDKSITQHSKTT